jgi:hypothetical protein
MGTPFDRTPLMGYANCWWGISRSALWGMLDAATRRDEARLAAFGEQRPRWA